MDAAYSRLRVRNIPEVPPDVMEAFESGSITPIPYGDRSRLIREPSLWMENGVHEFPDSTYLAAVSCHIPGVTLDMVRWWGWWFPGDVERYRTWLPDSNVDLTYAEKDADYFTAQEQPPFRPVTLYPVQKIGEVALPFRIDLLMPEDFGFSREDLERAGGPVVFCGGLRPRKGKYLYSDFAYLFFEEGDGVRFVARFWIGRTNGNRLLRMIMLTDRGIRLIGIGCYREYASLSGVVPELYALYNSGKR